ncbi:MAG TPA: hypothetical protein VL574_11770 [Stellaceae bacterium]|nr:hypothetical protein [Stellaceae bacterium]
MSALGRFALMLFPCSLVVLAVWNHPDFLISSDTLLPAALTWDLLHHHDAWSNFQQARVPSFFPDLTLYGLFQAVTDSWRVAMGLWTLTIIGWLIGIATWLSSRLAGTRPWPAALACLLLIMPLLILGSTGVGPSMDLDRLSHLPLFPYLIILLPFTHGGPFLLALATAAFASKTPMTPYRAVLLGVGSFALGLSDLLVVANLLLPLTLALAAGLHVGRVSKQRLGWLTASAWVGAGLGWAFAQTLDRQPVPYPPIAEIPHYVFRWLLDLERHPVMVLVVLALILAVAADMRWRGWKAWLGSFWSVFAATNAVTALLMTALLYNNMWSYRYALPCLWWPVILAAAGLSRIIADRDLLRRSVIPACLAFGLLCALPQPETPALFRWQSPLAACLERSGLHAGLAEYWWARLLTASTDWKLQVNQITPWGTAYIWGNDRSWFSHDIHDVALQPPYDFIVMDNIDQSQITTIYGEPDDTLTCGTSTVWLYDDPAQVNQALLDASSPHMERNPAVASK